MKDMNEQVFFNDEWNNSPGKGGVEFKLVFKEKYYPYKFNDDYIDTEGDGEFVD